MSQEDVEVVRRGYEHFAQTGEADLSVYSPDVEWHNAAEDPFAEPFHGVEGVRRLIQEVRESLDDFAPSRSSIWTATISWWRASFIEGKARGAPPRLRWASGTSSCSRRD